MRAGEEVRVSVVVPARRAAATIGDTLESIARQTWPVQEIVVAIPPDDEETREAVSLYRDRLPIRIVDNEPATTPAGLNRAIAASSGDIIARVDAHSVLPPDYIAKAASTLQRMGAGNVGGKQVPVSDSFFGRAVSAAMLHPLGAGAAAYRSGNVAGPADTVYLGVFRRSALEEIGAFDERFLRNQDAELNYRLRASGYLVHLDPDLAVEYRPRESVRTLVRQYFDYGRWRRATVQKHPDALRARQLIAPALVAVLLGSLLLGLVLTWWVGFAVVAAGYLGALIILIGATLHPLRMVPVVVLACIIMHLSWGTGFLIGPPSSGTSTQRD